MGVLLAAATIGLAGCSAGLPGQPQAADGASSVGANGSDGSAGSVGGVSSGAVPAPSFPAVDPSSGMAASSDEQAPSQSDEAPSSEEAPPESEQASDSQSASGDASSDQESGTTSSSADDNRPNIGWPSDLCYLLPTELTKGLEKAQGDPSGRCMYSGMVDGKFKSVSIRRVSLPLVPGEDPTGGNGTDLKTQKINGVTTYSFVKNNGKMVTVLFGTTNSTGYVDFQDDSLSPEKLRAAAIAAMKQVMDKLGVHS